MKTSIEQLLKTEYQKENGTLKFCFLGRLDIRTVEKLWKPTLDQLAEQQPRTLIIDLHSVSYCDSVGVVFLKKLKTIQESQKRQFQLLSLSEHLSYIQEQIVTGSFAVKHEKSKEPFRVGLGHAVVNVGKEFREILIFLGALLSQSMQVMANPRLLRWKDMWLIAEDSGPKALFIVMLTGFLIGLISTFQAAPSFEQFGVKVFLINLVGLGLIRELGPLLTAILLSGRTASSFAAELGTMKINQEVDALMTMGISPFRFLIIPRVLACTLMTPLLNVFFIVFGLLGCLVVMKTFGYPLDAFVKQLKDAIDITDCLGGLVKVFFFGLVIAVVGCWNGLNTSFGARGIGMATTKAVVNSLIMLVIVDGVFAVIYYVWGI